MPKEKSLPDPMYSCYLCTGSSGFPNSLVQGADIMKTQTKEGQVFQPARDKVKLFFEYVAMSIWALPASRCKEGITVFQATRGGLGFFTNLLETAMRLAIKFAKAWNGIRHDWQKTIFADSLCQKPQAGLCEDCPALR